MVIMSIEVVALWHLVMCSNNFVVVAMAAMMLVIVVFNVIIVASLDIFNAIVLNVSVSKVKMVSSSSNRSLLKMLK
jgi:hypothetical protein